MRADGLWGELVCETPLEHWSIGLEAFGIAYDDPADAWGDEWGERLPVGLDLEWEATAEPRRPVPPAGPIPRGRAGSAIAQPGRVHGEILVGPGPHPDLGTGFRSRASGVLDWWSGGPTPRLTWASDVAGVFDTRDEAARARTRRVPAPSRAREADAVTVLGEAPVLVTAPGRPPVRLGRALCQVARRRTGESAGPSGSRLTGSEPLRRS